MVPWKVEVRDWPWRAQNMMVTADTKVGRDVVIVDVRINFMDSVVFRRCWKPLLKEDYGSSTERGLFRASTQWTMAARPCVGVYIYSQRPR